MSTFIAILFQVRLIRKNPIYQSTATMIIDQEKYASPLTGQRMEFESIYSQEMTFNTHFKLILSKAVIQRVIKALNLGADTGQSNNKDLEISSFKKQIKQYKENLKLLLHIEDKAPPTPNERFNSLINAVRATVSI
jgi:succinoglycan biosynthesis transport protein ExoP